MAAHEGCGVPYPDAMPGTLNAPEALTRALREIRGVADGWSQRRGTLNDACQRFNRIAEIARDVLLEVRRG